MKFIAKTILHLNIRHTVTLISRAFCKRGFYPNKRYLCSALYRRNNFSAVTWFFPGRKYSHTYVCAYSILLMSHYKCTRQAPLPADNSLLWWVVKLWLLYLRFIIACVLHVYTSGSALRERAFSGVGSWASDHEQHGVQYARRSLGAHQRRVGN